MSDLEKIIDKFSGFITKEQAESILKDQEDGMAMNANSSMKMTMNVKELLDFISHSNKHDKERESENVPNSILNIKDKIYRIFNPTSINAKGRETIMRKVILGEEGSTVVLNLRDKLSKFMDINAFERGDTIVVGNALLDPSTKELKSGYDTIINKVVASKASAIADYSLIKDELRKVDVIGRIVEISPVRHVTRLGKGGQIAVASCTVTDSINLIDASFWGSSAIGTISMKTNDIIKIEFCDIRMRDGRMQIYVNDDSRTMVNNAFANRLMQGKR